jgi:hypothetical protein
MNLLLSQFQREAQKWIPLNNNTSSVFKEYISKLSPSDIKSIQKLKQDAFSNKNQGEYSFQLPDNKHISINFGPYGVKDFKIGDGKAPAPNVKPNPQQSGDPTKTEKQVCETDMDFFHQSHGLIAHISQASTGVGFEIGLATALHKPILCLGYKEFPARISPMISGNKHIQLYLYQNLDDTVAVINTFIDNL